MTKFLNASSERLEKLRLLFDDLVAYRSGKLPTDDDLERAPVLLLWTADQRPRPCLRGICGIHPEFRPGPLITSEVWWLDEALGFARTSSRLYRLGTRKD